MSEKFRMMMERYVGYATMHGRDMHKDPDAWGDIIREQHKAIVEYVEGLEAALALPVEPAPPETPKSEWVRGEEAAMAAIKAFQAASVDAYGRPSKDVPPAPDAADVPVTRPWKYASPDFQAGYRAGWADREGDLLCAIDRIAPPTGRGRYLCPECARSLDDHAPVCPLAPLRDKPTGSDDAKEEP